MAGIRGVISRIVYRNADNGYTVAEIDSSGTPVTLVGILPELDPGEPIEAEGTFTTHPLYGEQLQVERFTLTQPDDMVSIERYLGSGAIKGVGPALAARLVKKFRGQTLEIMEKEPQRLAEVKGISREGALRICAQVAEKREMRDAMMFLGQYGISLRLAVRIYEKYGPGLYDVIRQDPYRLIDDITSVGFRLADEIARQAGIAADSDFRIRSGLCYALTQALGAGHIYLPQSVLLSYAAGLLDLPEASLSRCLTDLVIDKKLVIRGDAEDPRVYLAAYYYMEAASAAMLMMLDRPLGLPGREEVEAAIDRLERQDDIRLEEMQRLAVSTAAGRGLMLLTGGPGTGKTTTIRTLLHFFEQQGLTIALAAPTGRAAKRITETTGSPAMTIHRLLEYSGMPQEGADRREELLRFERNESHPLEADAVIVDEVSMVDLPLLYALLKAVPQGARLILVGDANQLPSVGPGNVLRDMTDAGVFPHINLNRIFRQDEASDIVLNAHRIHRGEQIDLSARSRDFLMIRRDSAQAVIGAVLGLIRDKLPPYTHSDPLEIQVISPMRKGILGVENLNRVLQNFLNPPEEAKREHETARCVFRQGDKVMQIRNNYQKDWEIRGGSGLAVRRGTGVFNGDIGIITDVRLFSEELAVLFDEEKEAVYSFSELEDLELAYAVTVHKSQGSEYPAVILPLLSGPAPLMTRNLIYTAVTRARRCVCVVGLPETFQRMVDNDTEQTRYSTLDLQLREIRDRLSGETQDSFFYPRP